jgi:HK97 family phage major capsid protein
MEEKEFNELMAKIQTGLEKILKDSAKSGALYEAIKTEMEAATAGLVTGDQIAEKLEAIGLKAETVKEITDAVEKQGEEIQRLLQSKQTEDSTPLEQKMAEKKDEILNIAKTGSRQTVKFELSGKEVNKTLVQRSAVSGSTIATRLSEIGQLPFLEPVISNLFRSVSVGEGTGAVIRYIDQNAITRGADTVAETAQKPESVINWIERTLPLEVIADSIPVTKQAWADFDFLQGEVQRLLDTNLVLKEDEQLWDGDGTPPNLKGVYTSASAFSPTPYINITTVDNIYDLIAFVRTAIMTGKQSKYSPTDVVLNPIDVLRYKLAKGTDGHYLFPPFVSGNGTVIDNMRIHESSQVTANTMLVGDFRYGTRYTLGGVTVEMGHVDDQFVKNTFTILAEKRVGLLVRNVDADAFLKVTNITSAINTLIPSV